MHRNDQDFSFSQIDTLEMPSVSKTPLTEVPIIQRTPKKTQLIRRSLSETTTELMRIIKKPQVHHLLEYFEQTCDRLPDAPAVIYGASQLTYQELDQRANNFAHFLIASGIEQGDPIGILIEHSLDTYVTFLGVLKAGATFVPLDASFSSDLVSFIVEDAHLQGLVTTSAFREKTKVLSCPVLELDRDYEASSTQHQTRPQIQIDPASACYIIYAFSPSDRGKGVVFSHANIVNFLRVATPIYGVTRSDKVYQNVSTAFALSFEQIWSAWIAGAALVMGPTTSQGFGHELTILLNAHKITVLFCTPSLLATIESDVPSLRTLIVSGEPCPGYLVDRWSYPWRRMLNTYGPIETSVRTTWRELYPGRPNTLGSPFPSYQIYILDEQFKPVKEGESGEIYIGGPSVAVGYLNRPNLTRESFIPNPIAQDREMVPRLFRTGDFGRMTATGEIEYLGQIDAQETSTFYSIALNIIDELALSQGNMSPLLDYTPTLKLETPTVTKPEVLASRRKLMSQGGIKNLVIQILTDPLYKNSLFLMASTFILGGLGFFFWILIARLYKPEYVGIATTLISIMTLLSGFTVVGFNSSLLKYLPKSVNKNQLINSAFTIVTLMGVLASGIFLLGLPKFSPQLLFLRSNVFYIVSFAVFVIFNSLNMLVDSVFVAFRAASNVLLKNTTISILKLVLPFALISFAAYGIFASTALAFAIGVLMSFAIFVFKFEIKPSISINMSLIRETAKYSFANYISGFMLSTPTQLLPVIILNVLSAEYVAYYYIATMIQSLLLVVPIAASQALLTEGAYNEADMKKHIMKAAKTILVILVSTLR